MGYYVRMTEGDFKIPETPEVLQALKDLNSNPGVVKNGGSYGPNGRRIAWFSWMPADYDETVTSVKEVFDLLGFDTWVNPETPGYVDLEDYNGKTGQEELFLQTVAPFVKVNSYIVWHGEDGSLWKHIVDPNGNLLTLTGRVIYGDDPSY